MLAAPCSTENPVTRALRAHATSSEAKEGQDVQQGPFQLKELAALTVPTIYLTLRIPLFTTMSDLIPVPIFLESPTFVTARN